jgi:hypothetical protein
VIKASHSKEPLPPLEYIVEPIKGGEATELPFEFGWAQWDAAKLQQDKDFWSEK